MQVRSCWAVLTKKAKDTEELLQRSYANAQKKLRALQESRHRMDTLLDDYKKRALESQALLHSMVDTTNQRQFILHLQDLVSRVEKDIIQASIELEGAKLAMMQATHQRMKMETMQEKMSKLLRNGSANVTKKKWILWV